MYSLTYTFSQSVYQTVITVFQKCTNVNKSVYCTLLSSIVKCIRDVCGISNVADEGNDELNNTDNSDEELDESGSNEGEDQEEEGDNSTGDDDDEDDDDMENNEEESSEDDNGSDLESEGEKYNAQLQCFQAVLSHFLFLLF